MARINIGGDFIIRGVDTPVQENDAASKSYVDGLVTSPIALNLYGQFADFDAASSSLEGDTTYNPDTEMVEGITLGDGVGQWHTTAIENDNFRATTVIPGDYEAGTLLVWNVVALQGIGAPGPEGPFIIELYQQVADSVTSLPVPVATFSGEDPSDAGSFTNLGDWSPVFPGIATGMITYISRALYVPATGNLGGWSTPYAATALGPAGPAGPPGTTIARFNSTVAYDMGSVVYNEFGFFYIALADNPAAAESTLFNTALWQALGGANQIVTRTVNPGEDNEEVRIVLGRDNVDAGNPNHFMQVIGAGGVTVSSTAEGALTITGGAGGIEILTTDPASPTEGEAWYNSTDDVVRYYDGTTVQTVGTLAEIQAEAAARADGDDAIQDEITNLLTRTAHPTENYYQFAGMPVSFTNTGGDSAGAGLAFDDEFTIYQELTTSTQLAGNSAPISSTKVVLRYGGNPNDFREYLVVYGNNGSFYIADDSTVAHYTLEHIEDGYVFYSAASSGATNGGVTGLYESKLWLGNSRGGVVEIPHGTLFDGNGNLQSKTISQVTPQGDSDYYAVFHPVSGDNSNVTALDYFYDGTGHAGLIVGYRNGRVFRLRDSGTTISFDEGGILVAEMGDYTVPTSATFTTNKFNIIGIKSFTMNGADAYPGGTGQTFDNGSRLYVIYGDTGEARSPGIPIPGIAFANNLHSITDAEFSARGLARVPGGNDPSEQYVAYGNDPGESLYDDELDMRIFDVDYYSDGGTDQYLIFAGRQNNTVPADEAQMFYCDIVGNDRSLWQPQRLPSNNYKERIGTPIYSVSHGPDPQNTTSGNFVWLGAGNGAVWTIPNDLDNLGGVGSSYADDELLQAHADPSDSDSAPITTGDILGFDVFGITQADQETSVYAAGISSDGHVVRWDLQPDITVTVRHAGIDYVATYNYTGDEIAARDYFATPANFSPIWPGTINISTDRPDDQPTGQLYIDYSVTDGDIPGITVTHTGALVATDTAFPPNRPWRTFSETATTVTVTFPDGGYIFTTTLSSATADATAQHVVEQVRDTLNQNAHGITAQVLGEEFNASITLETPVLRITQPGVHAFSNRPTITITNPHTLVSRDFADGAFYVIGEEGGFIDVDQLLTETQINAKIQAIEVAGGFGTVVSANTGADTDPALSTITIDGSPYSIQGTDLPDVPTQAASTNQNYELNVVTDGASEATATWAEAPAPGSDVPNTPTGQGNETITQYVLDVTVDNAGDRDVNWVVSSGGDVSETDLASATTYQSDLLQLYPEFSTVILDGLIYERNDTEPVSPAVVTAPNVDATSTSPNGTYWTLEGSVGAGHEWNSGEHYIDGDIITRRDATGNYVLIASQESGGGGVDPQQPVFIGANRNVHYGLGNPESTDYWILPEAAIQVAVTGGSTLDYRGVARGLSFDHDQFTVSEVSESTGRSNISIFDHLLYRGIVDTNRYTDENSDGTLNSTAGLQLTGILLAESDGVTYTFDHPTGTHRTIVFSGADVTSTATGETFTWNIAAANLIFTEGAFPDAGGTTNFADGGYTLIGSLVSALNIGDNLSIDLDTSTLAATDTNTTYTFADGTNGTFTVTPSGGTTQTVSVGASGGGSSIQEFVANAAYSVGDNFTSGDRLYYVNTAIVENEFADAAAAIASNKTTEVLDGTSGGSGITGLTTFGDPVAVTNFGAAGFGRAQGGAFFFDWSETIVATSMYQFTAVDGANTLVFDVLGSNIIEDTTNVFDYEILLTNAIVLSGTLPSSGQAYDSATVAVTAAPYQGAVIIGDNLTLDTNTGTLSATGGGDVTNAITGFAGQGEPFATNASYVSATNSFQFDPTGTSGSPTPDPTLFYMAQLNVNTSVLFPGTAVSVQTPLSEELWVVPLTADGVVVTGTTPTSQTFYGATNVVPTTAVFTDGTVIAGDSLDFDPTSGILSVNAADLNTTVTLQVFGEFSVAPGPITGTTYNTGSGTIGGLPSEWSTTAVSTDNYIATTIIQPDYAGEELVWNILASGSQGPDGPQGPQGETGPFLVFLYQQLPDTDPVPAAPVATYAGNDPTDAANYGNLGSWVITFPGVTAGMTTYTSRALYSPVTETTGNLGGWSTPFSVTAQGPTGPAGPIGAPVGAYNAAINYPVDALVWDATVGSGDNLLYRSLMPGNINNTPADNPDDWAQVNGVTPGQMYRFNPQSIFLGTQGAGGGTPGDASEFQTYTKGGITFFYYPNVQPVQGGSFTLTEGSFLDSWTLLG